MNERKNRFKEEELIQALTMDESWAFEHLYREGFPQACSYVLKNGGAVDDAKDIFQEALVVLIENLKDPEFKLTCAVRTYLYSIARNKWFNQRKKNKPTLAFEETTMDFLDLGEDLIQSKILFEEKHRLSSKSFQQLKDDCRQLLLNFYYRRTPLKKLAVILDLTEESIKVKRHRCMQYLSKLVKDDPDFQNLEKK